jgi:hypothetical protein
LVVHTGSQCTSVVCYLTRQSFHFVFRDAKKHAVHCNTIFVLIKLLCGRGVNSIFSVSVEAGSSA